MKLETKVSTCTAGENYMQQQKNTVPKSWSPVPLVLHGVLSLFEDTTSDSSKSGAAKPWPVSHKNLMATEV